MGLTRFTSVCTFVRTLSPVEPWLFVFNHVKDNGFVFVTFLYKLKLNHFQLHLAGLKLQHQPISYNLTQQMQ